MLFLDFARNEFEQLDRRKRQNGQSVDDADVYCVKCSNAENTMQERQPQHCAEQCKADQEGTLNGIVIEHALGKQYRRIGLAVVAVNQS